MAKCTKNIQIRKSLQYRQFLSQYSSYYGKPPLKQAHKMQRLSGRLQESNHRDSLLGEVVGIG